jgi:NACalpha-BTF3-like transcription factor
MADDLNKQLRIQTEINKVLAKRSAVLEAQSGYLSGQAQIAKELCKAMECQDLDGMEERLNDIKKGMTEAADKAGELAGANNDMADASKAAGKAARTATKDVKGLWKQFKTTHAAAAGMLVGMYSGFKSSLSMISSFGSLLGSAAKGVFSLGKSIISIPFKIFSGLVGQANKLHGTLSALRQEIENVRKEFGNLSTGPGKDVMKTFKGMRASSNNLAGSGMSLYKIFGPGPEGAAKALAFVSEQAKGMGAQFHHFGKEIANMGPKFAIYIKGLGLSGEQTGALAARAQAAGKTLEETFQDVSNYALQMGKQFGMSSKEIARDMADMSKDVASFGTLSVKELAQVAVYAKKLGIEAKALQGVINKFDNFEDAAKSASMLAQSFGMNIDAMAMMNENDPAKRMEMLRKSFHDTGKSVEDLSRQELKLLSSQMGLDEAQTKLALSNKNLDYKDITKGGDKAKKGALTQAKAMMALAKSIEKVFKSGQGAKSFWEAFTGGFMKGLSSQKEYRKMLLNIRQSMHEVYKGGRKLGAAFFKFFPGVKDMVKSLRDLFDPRNVRKLMNDVVRAFKTFFKTVQDDPSGGVKTLLEKLKEAFKNFFDTKKGAGKGFIEGLKKFGSTLALLFLNLLPYAIKGLASLVQKLADFIADPRAFTGGMDGMSDKMKKAFTDAFDRIQEALPILWKSIKSLFGSLWGHLGPLLSKVWPYLLTAVLIKMMIGGFMGLLKAVVIKKVGGYVMGKLFGDAMGSGADKAAPAATEGIQDALNQQTGVTKSAKEFFAAIAEISPMDVVKAGFIALILATFFAVGFVMLAAAVALAIKTFNSFGVTKEETLLAITAIITASLGAAAVAYVLNKMGDIDFKSVMKSLGVLALVMVAMGALGIAIAWCMKKADPIPSVGKVIAFFFMVMVSLLSAWAAILIAIPIGASISGVFGQVLLGLFILGVVMVAMAGVGVLIGKMVEAGVKNPAKVGAFMGALAALMIATALMIPVAGMLGLMLVAWPWGTAGVAIILLGFGVLGTLAAAMVASLMPAIEMISNIKLENPAHFKMITEAIVAIVKGVAAFAEAIGGIMKTLKPSLWGALSGETLQGNIEAATGFVCALMQGGIQPMIDSVIGLAKSTNISKEAVEAVKAIGTVIEAVASILTAMKPDPETIKAISGGAMARFWDPTGRVAEKMMKQLAGMMEVAKCSALEIINTVKDTFFKPEFLQLFNGVDPNAGKVIGAFGPLLSGIADTMKSMQPSDETMKAVNKASGFWSGGARGGALILQKMTAMMVAMEQPVKSLIDAVGTNLVSVVQSMVPIFRIVGSMDVKPEVIDAVAEIISAVMNAMAGLISNVFPVFQDILKQTDKYSDAMTYGIPKRIAAMNDLMTNTVQSLVTMGPAIKDMVNNLLDVAKGIKNPTALKASVEVIASIFKVMNDLGEMFAGKDATFNAYAVGAKWEDSSIGAMQHNMKQFNKSILGDSGPLQEFITKMSGIKAHKYAAFRAKQIAAVFGALGAMMEGVQKFEQASPQGGAQTAEASGTAIKTALVEMNKLPFDCMSALGAKIASTFSGRIWVEPKHVENAGKSMEALGTLMENMLTVTQVQLPLDPAYAWSQIYTNVYWMGINAGKDGIGGAITTSMQTSLTKATDLITKMVEDYNTISYLLANVNDLNIDAQITEFSDNLNVTHKKIQIDNSAVNITVNLNLRMDADKIAASLSTTEGRTDSVKLSLKGGKPQT